MVCLKDTAYLLVTCVKSVVDVPVIRFVVHFVMLFFLINFYSYADASGAGKDVYEFVGFLFSVSSSFPCFYAFYSLRVINSFHAIVVLVG